MSSDIDRLATVLEEELTLTRRLLDLAKDARAAAVSADPALLAQIVAEQEEQAARLEAVEADRAAVVAALAGELGLDGAGRVRLTAIADALGAEDGARLRRLGGRLRACAADLREASARTRQVLEASLIHIDDFFGLLAEVRSQRGSAYGARRERAAATAGAALMDRKA